MAKPIRAGQMPLRLTDESAIVRSVLIW